MTIELPNDLATELAALLPEAERTRFAVDAVAEAVRNRQQDEAECISDVENALADMDAGRGLVSFEEAVAHWRDRRVVMRSSVRAGGQ